MLTDKFAGQFKSKPKSVTVSNRGVSRRLPAGSTWLCGCTFPGLGFWPGFGHMPAAPVVPLCDADRIRWCHNSIGGDWFRLRWLIQGKRAEGCDYDLVNPVAAHV